MPVRDGGTSKMSHAVTEDMKQYIFFFLGGGGGSWRERGGPNEHLSHRMKQSTQRKK